MKTGKKIQRKLNARVDGYEKQKSMRHESKVQQRYDTGGYKKPGSMSQKSR